MRGTVIDNALVIECIKEARQNELDAKDDENSNSSYGNKKKKAKQGTTIKIDEEGFGDSAVRGRRGKSQQFDFSAVTELPLSFRDIFRIDHLRGFENVVKLRLDNNRIQRIENLEHMVNLEWLDLSFNQISKIQGLEQLTKLTDLSLINNFIAKIENLDANINLQVLSLANNCIDAIDDNIVYLRQFEQLHALNLKGNPICSSGNEAELRSTVLAFCKHLKFLDYDRVEDREKEKAYVLKEEELAEIEELEMDAKQRIGQDKKDAVYRALLTKSNIIGIDTLFQDILREDSEMLRLVQLPGVQQHLNVFKKQLDKNTGPYVESVVAVHNEKLQEDKHLQHVLAKICADSERYCIDVIAKFETENSAQDKKDEEGIKRVSDLLMESEMQCVEKVNFSMNVYEDRITDLMKKNLNEAEIFFAEVQSLQNEYHEEMIKQIASIVDTIKHEGVDSVIEALPENEAIRNMIVDKEAINNSVTVSHDNHTSLIGRLEDLVRDREEKEKKGKMDEQSNTQYKRNRQKVSEILIFVDKCKKKLKQ